MIPDIKEMSKEVKALEVFRNAIAKETQILIQYARQELRYFRRKQVEAIALKKSIPENLQKTTAISLVEGYTSEQLAGVIKDIEKAISEMTRMFDTYVDLMCKIYIASDSRDRLDFKIRMQSVRLCLDMDEGLQILRIHDHNHKGDSYNKVTTIINDAFYTYFSINPTQKEREADQIFSRIRDQFAAEVRHALACKS